jgi:hypothetical protein
VTKYENKDGKPELIRLLFLDDDQAGNAFSLDLFVGKRLYAAFDNSTGGREILKWTGAGKMASVADYNGRRSAPHQF